MRKLISFSINSLSRPYLSREISRYALANFGFPVSKYGLVGVRLKAVEGCPSMAIFATHLNLSIFTRSMSEKAGLNCFARNSASSGPTL